MYKTVVTRGVETDKDFDEKSFLEYLRPSNNVWLPTAKGARQEWVFRGHIDEDWKLVPGMGRDSDCRLVTKIKTKIEELNGEATWQSADVKVKRLAATIALYITLMRKFVSICYDVGAWDAPPGQDPFWNGLPWMFADFDGKSFQLNGPSISPLPHDLLEDGTSDLSPTIQFPGNKSAIAALAQHHDMPTFLLDWSDNPLVAAYFACRAECPEKNMCVWALDVSRLNSNDHLKCPIGINRPPKSTNRFLHAQSGLLTYFRNDYKLWQENGAYPCMEVIIEEWNKKNKKQTCSIGNDEDDTRTSDEICDQDQGCVLLKKIILKQKHIKPLRELLRHERISKEYLMPSFDNIAAEAKRECL
jgi:FRG domain